MILAEKKFQAFRLVSLDGSSTPVSDIQYVEARFDHKAQQHIVLWNDIIYSYKDAVHIKQGRVTLSFLTDDKFEYLKPLRIRAEPDTILDMVVSLKANNPREPCSESILPQEIKEEPATEGSYEFLAPSAVSNNTKSFETDMKVPSGRQDGVASSTGVALSLEGVPSSESTASTAPAVEESAELMAAPLGGVSQLGSIDNIPSNRWDYSYYIEEVRGCSETPSSPPDWLTQRALWDPSAQAHLGYVYYHGRGVSQDYSRAIDWFTKAADQGNSAAQSNLGCMYEHGRGVLQDYSIAVDWYLKAASQGNLIAQSNLGYMYFYGKGVLQSYSKALDWCLKAANQGGIAAQNNLGYMYLSSHDYSKATYWLYRAANQGHTDAQNNLGYMYSRGKGVSQNYSEAVDWYLKAANHGNAIAQNNLGYMYYHGIGVSQDYSKAFDWYLKGADQGCVDAQGAIGYMYRFEKGVPKDLIKAK